MCESTNADRTRGLVHSGPMRTVLNPLHGRCTSLKSLVLNKFGLELPECESRDWSKDLHTSVWRRVRRLPSFCQRPLDNLKETCI